MTVTERTDAAFDVGVSRQGLNDTIGLANRAT